MELYFYNKDEIMLFWNIIYYLYIDLQNTYLDKEKDIEPFEKIFIVGNFFFMEKY